MINLIKQYIDKYGDINVDTLKAIAFINIFIDDYMHLKKLKYKNRRDNGR